MDDQKPDSKPELQPVTPSLKGAIRRARIDEAERSGVMSELRGAEIARLEMLAEALEPVFSQVPDHVDIFDAGVVPGETPRLYVDMIAFVEMGPDKRTYRFIQNTRQGRVIAGTSEKIDTMTGIITTYVARRLVEREQALAGDRTIEEAARAYAALDTQTAQQPAIREPVQKFATSAPAAAATAAPIPALTVPSAAAPRPRRRFWGAVTEGLIFIAELIGFIVLLVALFGALYFAWTLGEAWWISYFNKAT